jgi:hypothetical protein
VNKWDELKAIVRKEIKRLWGDDAVLDRLDVSEPEGNYLFVRKGLNYSGYAGQVSEGGADDRS